MGYVGNNSSLIEEDSDDAFLVLSSGDFNHGGQIKLRALHQLTIPVPIFAEINLKSLYWPSTGELNQLAESDLIEWNPEAQKAITIKPKPV